MKRIFSVLFVLAVVLTTTSTVYAQCADATLNASYAFVAPGFSTPSRDIKGVEVPIAAMGVFTLDGAGDISTSYTLAFRGQATSGLSGTGTYSVNSDCTGSISFTTGDANGLNFNMAIIGGGAEIFGILTTPTSVATFDAKKQ